MSDKILIEPFDVFQSDMSNY